MPAGEWVLQKLDERGNFWYLRVLAGRRRNPHGRRQDVYDWAHCPAFATAFGPADDPAGVAGHARRVAPGPAIYKVLTPAEALAAWHAHNDARRRLAASDAVPLEGPDVGGQVVVDPV